MKRVSPCRADHHTPEQEIRHHQSDSVAAQGARIATLELHFQIALDVDLSCNLHQCAPAQRPEWRRRSSAGAWAERGQLGGDGAQLRELHQLVG